MKRVSVVSGALPEVPSAASSGKVRQASGDVTSTPRQDIEDFSTWLENFAKSHSYPHHRGNNPTWPHRGKKGRTPASRKLRRHYFRRVIFLVPGSEANFT